MARTAAARRSKTTAATAPPRIPAADLQAARAKARYAAQVLRAREDPDSFCEFVFRAEKTQQLLEQAPVHRKWQQAFTEYDQLVLFSAVEHGKTTQVVARLLWEIGLNPNIRIAVISNTAAQALKMLTAIRQYIEHSDEYRAVFPHVRPSSRPDDKWTQSAITVERDYGTRDPTVQALGIHGPVMGSRLDIIVCDDVLDVENTRTKDQRNKLIEWVNGTLPDRLIEGGRMWVVGISWHPDDLMHHLEKRPLWFTIRDPAIQNGKAIWPEQWPLSRLEEKRAKMLSLEFARKYLCVARDDASSRFKKAWIEKAKARGRGHHLVSVYHGPLPTVTGVDLGVGEEEKHALTAFVTLAIHPDESRQLLAIETGRWTGPDIVKKIIKVHKDFRSVIRVENNAAQKYIQQFTTAQSAVPIRGHTTGRSKAHPELGIESIAVEMENGKWIIPCDAHGRVHPEIQELLDDMLYYSPKAHTGDRLMALWFAREMAKELGTVGVVTGLNMLAR